MNHCGGVERMLQDDRAACLLELMVYWSSAGGTELERGHSAGQVQHTQLTDLNRLMSIIQLLH